MEINDIYESENGNNHYICKLTEEEKSYIIENNFSFNKHSILYSNTLDYSFVVDPTGYLWETFMFQKCEITNIPVSVKKVINRYKKLKRLCEDE